MNKKQSNDSKEGNKGLGFIRNTFKVKVKSKRKGRGRKETKFSMKFSLTVLLIISFGLFLGQKLLTNNTSPKNIPTNVPIIQKTMGDNNDKPSDSVKKPIIINDGKDKIEINTENKVQINITDKIEINIGR